MSRRLPIVLSLALAAGSSLPVLALDEAEALYQDKDYQASYDAYDARLKESGHHRWELEYSAGTAAFKSENYPLAAEHLGRAILSEDETLQAKAYYNLGNTLFRLGQASEDSEEIEAQWESAIEHYREVESLGGDLERNARHNRQVVEQHLAAMKGEEPPEQDQEQKQDGDQGQDSQDQQEGEGGEQQQPESGDEQKEGQDQQGQDQQEGQDQQGQDQQEGQDQQGQDQQGQDGKPGEEEGQQEGDSSSGQEGEEGDQQDDQEGQGKDGKPVDEQEGMEGEVKAADDGNEKGDPKAESSQKPSAYELTPDGKLSEAGARALLESLEGEEVKAPFEVRRSKQRRRVLRDW